MVDFTFPFWHDYVTVVYPAPPLKLNIWYFTHPLHWHVLVAMAALVLLSNAVALFSDWLNGKEVSKMAALENTLRTVLLQPGNLRKKSHVFRLVSASSLFTVMILAATFKSNLITFLGISFLVFAKGIHVCHNIG